MKKVPLEIVIPIYNEGKNIAAGLGTGERQKSDDELREEF